MPADARALARGSVRENCFVDLEGDRVVLRTPRTSDVDDLAVIFAEPDVALWWPRFDRAKIEREVLHPDEDTTVYTVAVDGEVAGVVQSWEEDDPDTATPEWTSRWQPAGTAQAWLSTYFVRSLATWCRPRATIAS